ncbi:MAG TPA: branched-chain amino acid ABC transporter permease [Desulfobacterales bacterium]|nr:branched-chain amino acid ABC transporter permease [Desulfobacterales bacterium]
MLLQVILSGLATGSIYALVALGLALIYNTTEHVNFAQGEMSMVSAFIGFTFFHSAGFSLPVAFLLTLAVSAVLGIIVERLVIRPAMRAPHFNIFIITLGLSIVMKSLAGFIWSHDDFPYPSIFPNETITVGNATIDMISIGNIGTTVILMLMLFIFFKYTRYGTAMRAVSHSQNAALLMGISVKQSFSITWAISFLVAAVAGILMAPVVFLSTHMGMVVINGFAAAILGGWGSIPGSIIGGMLLGIIDNVAPLYLPSQIKNVVPFMVICIVLVIRPKGIMGIERLTKV